MRLKCSVIMASWAALRSSLPKNAWRKRRFSETVETRPPSAVCEERNNGISTVSPLRNTAAGVASFGGKSAYFGKVSADHLGQIFTHDIHAQGVAFD